MKDGNKAVKQQKDSGKKTSIRLQTGDFLTRGAAPTEPDPAPVESLTLPPDNTRDHLAAVAPMGVAKTAGLPPGATYGQCLREGVLRAAIAGDMSAAKDLLERLEGEVSKQPPREPIKVVIEMGEGYKEFDALGTYDNRDAASRRAFQQRLWELSTKNRLELEENAPRLLAAWAALPRTLKDMLWAEIVELLTNPEAAIEAAKPNNETVN